MNALDDGARLRRYAVCWGLQVLALGAVISGVLWALVASGAVLPGTRGALILLAFLWLTASVLAGVYQRLRYGIGLAEEIRRAAPPGPGLEVLTGASFVACSFLAAYLLHATPQLDGRGPGVPWLMSAFCFLALCFFGGTAGLLSERVKICAYPGRPTLASGLLFVLGLLLATVGVGVRSLGGAS